MTGVAWSPDGTRLATGSDDWTVRIWNPTTGQTTPTLTGHTNRVTAVAWSPDGTHLATTSRDETVRIWNSATGQTTHTLTGHTGVVTGVAWSPDGTHLATTNPSGTVALRTHQGEESTSVTVQSATCLAWSAANRLAIGQNEGRPAVFDLVDNLAGRKI